MSETHKWRGASGKEYLYYVHELSWKPKKDQKGNYVFAKMVGMYWEPVYIGQGDLQDRYAAALDEGCVTTKAPTHYHLHMNSNEIALKDEERDLIDGNPACRWPNGCNGKG